MERNLIQPAAARGSSSPVFHLRPAEILDPAELPLPPSEGNSAVDEELGGGIRSLGFDALPKLASISL